MVNIIKKRIAAFCIMVFPPECHGSLNFEKRILCMIDSVLSINTVNANEKSSYRIASGDGDPSAARLKVEKGLIFLSTALIFVFLSGRRYRRK